MKYDTKVRIFMITISVIIISTMLTTIILGAMRLGNDKSYYIEGNGLNNNYIGTTTEGSIIVKNDYSDKDNKDSEYYIITPDYNYNTLNSVNDNNYLGYNNDLIYLSNPTTYLTTINIQEETVGEFTALTTYYQSIITQSVEEYNNDSSILEIIENYVEITFIDFLDDNLIYIYSTHTAYLSKDSGSYSYYSNQNTNSGLIYDLSCSCISATDVYDNKKLVLVDSYSDSYVMRTTLKYFYDYFEVDKNDYSIISEYDSYRASVEDHLEDGEKYSSVSFNYTTSYSSTSGRTTTNCVLTKITIDSENSTSSITQPIMDTCDTSNTYLRRVDDNHILATFDNEGKGSLVVYIYDTNLQLLNTYSIGKRCYDFSIIDENRYICSTYTSNYTNTKYYSTRIIYDTRDNSLQTLSKQRVYIYN